jgi:hypothetical protein
MCSQGLGVGCYGCGCANYGGYLLLDAEEEWYK